MDYLLYTAQCTMKDWYTFGCKHLSLHTPLEHENVQLYLKKHDTFRELMLAHSSIMSKNYDFAFSSHPKVFRIFPDELSETDVYFAQWIHDVMEKAPHFFCIATSHQFFTGLISDLFEDYLHYGPYDFFNRLLILHKNFSFYLHSEFLNNPYYNEEIDDCMWEDGIRSTDILGFDELPSAYEWYRDHRHDVIVFSYINEIELNM